MDGIPTVPAPRLPRPIVFERGVDYANMISYFLACARADRRPPPFGFIRRHVDLEPTGHLTSARIEWHHEVDFLSEAHELARSIGKELAFEENLWESSEFDGRFVLRDPDLKETEDALGAWID